MKYITLSFLLMTVFVINSQSQSTDSLYVVTYTTGPTWDINKQPFEQPYFKEHSTRLSQLRKDGVIKFGGRYGEKGMIVIASKSFSIAKELILSDDAVIHKLFDADIQKLNIFYEGCLEASQSNRKN